MSSVPTSAHVVTGSGTFNDKDVFLVEEKELEPIGPHDLLVEIKAVSVNPVDTKARMGFGGKTGRKQLGYDAAGIVVAVGQAVSAFKVGDEVYYAGNIMRPGSNADYQLVDERLVGPKPKTLDFAAAAALPLTTITAYEALFVQLGIPKSKSKTGNLLVFGAAGGVGSIMIQLARHYTGLTVIATATRPDSIEFAKKQGAHHVVPHTGLQESLAKLAPKGVNYIFCPKTSQKTIDEYVQVAAHRARVVQIDEPKGMDYVAFQGKAMSLSYEMMFSVGIHDPESTEQRDLLKEVAQLVDEGKIRSTLTKTLQGLNPQTLKEAHAQLESGSTIGKVVIVR